jgi:tyrosyl-tRNA synthetase
MMARAVPTVEVSAEGTMTLIDALVAGDAPACASKGEARRLLKQNAVAINGVKVQDEAADLANHRAGAGAAIISVGKAKRLLVRFL